MAKVTRARQAKFARIESPFRRSSVAPLRPRDLSIESTLLHRPPSTPAELFVHSLLSADGRADFGATGPGADVVVVSKVHVETILVRTQLHFSYP